MKSFLISALLLLLSIGAAITCSVYTDHFCNAVTELTEKLPDDSELSEMGAIERGESSDAEMNFSADSSDALAALNELSELWDKHRKIARHLCDRRLSESSRAIADTSESIL